jgi:hypothetical protein
MILGWLAIAEDHCITTVQHKTNRMQGPNHLGNSRIVRLNVISLIRHGRMQHAQQSIRNLPSLCGCTAVAGWPKDKHSTDNHAQKNSAATDQKELAAESHGSASSGQ